MSKRSIKNAPVKPDSFTRNDVRRAIKLSTSKEAGIRDVKRLLAEVRSLRPSQVVVWYSIPGGDCGVVSTKLTSRTTTVGALNSAALEVWNS